MSDIISKLKTGTPQLSVGTLTGDMEDQAKEVKLLADAGVNCHHVDVMNGTAWPKETVGADYVAGIETSLVKDIHLLTDQPETLIADFAKAGADIITFQVEQGRSDPERLQESLSYHQSGLSLAEAVDDPWEVARNWRGIGMAHALMGQPSPAGQGSGR